MPWQRKCKNQRRRRCWPLPFPRYQLLYITHPQAFPASSGSVRQYRLPYRTRWIKSGDAHQTQDFSVGITHIPVRKIYDDNKTLGEGCPNLILKWFLALIWYDLTFKPARRNIVYTSNTMLSSVTHKIPNVLGSVTILYWWINVCKSKYSYKKSNIYFIRRISYPQLF